MLSTLPTPRRGLRAAFTLLEIMIALAILGLLVVIAALAVAFGFRGKAMAQENRGMDLPAAALLSDLRQRGLLEDTLLDWAACVDHLREAGYAVDAVAVVRPND